MIDNILRRFESQRIVKEIDFGVRQADDFERGSGYDGPPSN